MLQTSPVVLPRSSMLHDNMARAPRGSQAESTTACFVPRPKPNSTLPKGYSLAARLEEALERGGGDEINHFCVER